MQTEASVLLRLIAADPSKFHDPKGLKKECKDALALKKDAETMTPDAFDKKHPRSYIWDAKQALVDYTPVVTPDLFPGVNTITVTFSGSGDDGSLDDPETDTGVELSSDAADFINDFVADIANGLPDWCNNEGGGGEFTIDVKTGEVTCDSYQNEEEAHSDDGTGKLTKAILAKLKKDYPGCVKLLWEDDGGSSETYVIGADGIAAQRRPYSLPYWDDLDRELNEDDRPEYSTREVVVDLKTGVFTWEHRWTETIEGDHDVQTFNIYYHEKGASDE